MTARLTKRTFASRTTLLGLLAASLFQAPTAAHAATTTTKNAPAYTFVDNFNGRSLDTSRWTAGDTATNWNGIGTGNCHLAENVRVANGYLHLTSTVSPEPFTCSYPTGDTFQTHGASAEVHTKGRFAQTYGTWQIRARFPATGSHATSALWMYPEKETYGAWPRSGEIDIVERMPWSDSWAYNSVHYLDASGGTSFDKDDGDGNPGETGVCTTDLTQWHVYGLTWDRSRMTFTIDGTVCSSMGWSPEGLTNPAPFDHPFFTVLRQGASVHDTEVTQKRVTLVDWVRVSQ